MNYKLRGLFLLATILMVSIFLLANLSLADSDITEQPVYEIKQGRNFLFKPDVLENENSFKVENMPSWLSFDPETGTISGVASSYGVFKNITIYAEGPEIRTIGPFSIEVIGDPLTEHAWHLNNTGQKTFALLGGQKGVDINLSETFKKGDITGAGVRVAVSDTGVEIAHPDLNDNILNGASRDYTGNEKTGWSGQDPTPPLVPELDIPPAFLFLPFFGSMIRSAHGTAVAGLIGAEGWNGIGSRGVAPDAGLAGFLFLRTNMTIDKKLDQADGDFDIFNYSYGYPECKFFTPDKDYIAQLKHGVNKLRNGKGALYVKAAGNSYRGRISECHWGSTGGKIFYYGNSNLSGENAYPYIISVGAINARGVRSSYSSPGSNLWISAPGGEYGQIHPATISTDLVGCESRYNNGYANDTATTNDFEDGHDLNPNCDYTSRMNGTSAATPITSGVIALMLEANPNLTWRDVKHILAKTATRIDEKSQDMQHPIKEYRLPDHTYQQGWVENKAGYWFHNWYGFGMVNVDEAVEMAQKYKSKLGKFYEISDYDSSLLELKVPDNCAKGVTHSLEVKQHLVVESIQIQVTVEHTALSDLGVELISPSGTKSILLNVNSNQVGNGLVDAMLLTNAFYGENAAGSWTIKIIDGHEKETGIFKNWKIKLFGHFPEEAPLPPTELHTNRPYFSSKTVSPVFHWQPSDSDTVVKYQYSVGTEAGKTDILKWTEHTDDKAVQASGLLLSEDKTYFLNLRAVDKYENISESTSASWTVDTVVAPVFLQTKDGPGRNIFIDSTVRYTGHCEPRAELIVETGPGVEVVRKRCTNNGHALLVVELENKVGLGIIGTIISNIDSHYNAKVFQRDRAGNLSKPIELSMTYVQ